MLFILGMWMLYTKKRWPYLLVYNEAPAVKLRKPCKLPVKMMFQVGLYWGVSYLACDTSYWLQDPFGLLVEVKVHLEALEVVWLRPRKHDFSFYGSHSWHAHIGFNNRQFMGRSNEVKLWKHCIKLRGLKEVKCLVRSQEVKRNIWYL